MQKLLAKLFLITGAGFFIFASYLFYERNFSNPLTFKAKPQVIHYPGDQFPKTIQIPSINATLPIVPSVIHGKSWETTSRGVSYLKTTPLPGTKGNSVIYGHNWKSILGNLPQVKPGQRIIITMNDGAKKEFKVEYTATVEPSQTYIIDNTKDSRVTIYTCTGFLDSKRFVVVALPVS